MFGGRAQASIQVGDAGITSLLIFIQDSDGRERVVFSVTGAPIYPAFSNIPLGSAFLTRLLREDDQGVFVRFVGGGVGTSMLLAFNDMRGVTRTDTALPLNSLAPTVISPSVPVGSALKVSVDENTDGLLFTSVAAFNFSTAAMQEIAFDLFDGTDAYPVIAGIPLPVAPVADVTSNLPPVFQAGEITIPPGYALRARLLSNAVDGPVVVAVTTRKTNQSPVREDQGGAY